MSSLDEKLSKIQHKVAQSAYREGLGKPLSQPLSPEDSVPLLKQAVMSELPKTPYHGTGAWAIKEMREKLV